MRVSDLMVEEVVTIPATATVQKASDMLRVGEVSGAPVVDEQGNPIGVVSRTDLAYGWERAEVERRRTFYTAGTGEGAGLPVPPPQDVPFGDKPVREIMMPLVFSVERNDSIQKAAALMSAEGIHRVFVMDGTRLAGVLSASTIVDAVARGELVERR